MESAKSLTEQIGPCGIICATCFLGKGTMSKTMADASQFIKMSGIKEWAYNVPEGSEINWFETEKALNWMQRYATCAGCENGGGPPDCVIRLCSVERKIDLCNQCDEMDDCNKFNWLGNPEQLKVKLKETRGKPKQDIIKDALQLP
jgi:hypothetical protein